MAKSHYNRTINSDKIVVDGNLKIQDTIVIPVNAGEPDLSAGIDEDGQFGIRDAGADPRLFFKTGGTVFSVANLDEVEKPVNKNQPNGYAGLDSGGKVAAAQLPSYVDDVLEVANFAALPVTGESGKIYVTLDTNLEYRWSGSTYIQIVASPGSTDALAEGSTNKYFTAARVLATTLAGLDLSSTADVVAADTIIQAIGKLQAHLSIVLPTVTSGEKVLTVTSTGIQKNYDLEDQVISNFDLVAADWSTGIAAVTGVVGQKSYSNDYEYTCVGVNQWRRSALNDVLVDLYLADTNDSGGLKSASDLNTAFPASVYGQRTWGTAGYYEKRTTNWAYMAVTFV